MSGTGTVYSWTVVEHQVHPSFPVPYTVVLVELDELPGTRLLGHLAGLAELTVGQPMVVWFETLITQRVGEAGVRVVLPQWRLL